MEISLNQNFSSNVSNLYSGSLSTVLPDVNALINAEEMFGTRGIENIGKTFPNSKINIKIIRKEVESKINLKPVYKFIGIDYDGIQEEKFEGYADETISYEGSSLKSNGNESSSTDDDLFSVPYIDSITISSRTWEDEILKVNYIDGMGKFFQVIYSAHSLKHFGDGGILFQAMCLGNNNSLVITDEYEKENRKNLGYDLRINGITNYSMHYVLPVMVVKNIITKEEMLRASKKLSTCTNRFVDEKFLIESLINLDKFKNN